MNNECPVTERPQTADTLLSYSFEPHPRLAAANREGYPSSGLANRPSDASLTARSSGKREPACRCRPSLSISWTSHNVATALNLIFSGAEIKTQRCLIKDCQNTLSMPSLTSLGISAFTTRQHSSLSGRPPNSLPRDTQRRRP